jgi:hypothetical protein
MGSLLHNPCLDMRDRRGGILATATLVGELPVGRLLGLRSWKDVTGTVLKT